MTQGITRPTLRPSSRSLSFGRGPATDLTHVSQSVGYVPRQLPGSFRNSSRRRPRTRGAGSFQREPSIGADARRGSTYHDDNVYQPSMPFSERGARDWIENDEPSIDEPMDDDDAINLNFADDVQEEGTGTHLRGENTSHERIILTLHGDDLFHPKTGIEMTAAMKGRISGDWPCWSAVPPAVKKLMCREWMLILHLLEDQDLGSFSCVGMKRERRIVSSNKRTGMRNSWLK